MELHSYLTVVGKLQLQALNFGLHTDTCVATVMCYMSQVCVVSIILFCINRSRKNIYWIQSH